MVNEWRFLTLFNKDKNKRLQLFDIAKDGKGISKSKQLKDSSLARFFVSYKDNMGKLLYTNIIMVLGNFPLIFLIAVLSGYSRTLAYLPTFDISQNLGGLFMIEPTTPSQMALYALEGLPTQIMIDTTLTYVFYGISALFLLTFGIVNVGCAYILRNLAMGDAVFVWSDFFYAVKRNIKQALPFGIIDGLINALLIYNIYITMTASDFMVSMMFWSNIIVAVLYFFMRCYIYVQMVTFKLSVFKILKNSLIFAIIGIKRNVLALLGTILLVIIEVMLVFGAGGLLISLGVALPLTLMFSTMAYMKIFAAYFKIKEIMIDPYKAEHPEEFASEENEDDVIMVDEVTERERLEEIKRMNGII